LKNQKSSLLKALAFSRSEKRGILVLGALLISLFSVRLIIFNNNKPLENEITGTLFTKQEVKNVESERDNEQKVNSYRKPVINEKRLVEVNTCGYKDLVSIGFSEYAAKNIIAYRKKAGNYRFTEQLMRVYGVDTEIFNQLRGQLWIEKNTKAKEQPGISRKGGYMFNIDLNKADTNLFVKLPGIGEKLSSRILKYRTALGGFYSIDQLKEVYGISDSLFRKLSLSISADTSSIRKINLNKVKLEELQRHPYLNRYLAKAIVGYRRLAGPFKSPDDLIDYDLMPVEIYSKIKPYLVIQ
jgi:competence protein ComEA